MNSLRKKFSLSIIKNKFNSKSKNFKNSTNIFKKNSRNVLGKKVGSNILFNINITPKNYRVFDSIVNRRAKLLRRLLKLNLNIFNKIMTRYSTFRWLKDNKIVWGISKYKKELESLESQGLKRKITKRRLKIYGIALLDKQKLKGYYFGLKEHMLKHIVKYVFSCKINHLKMFVNLLESRLLSFLGRTNLFKSLNQLRIFIKLGYILINDRVVTNGNYSLKIGDKISSSYIPKNKNLYINNIRKRFSLFYYSSKYMEVSFPLMIFLYYRSPSVSDVSYPFTINLSRILSYYNYKGLK